MLDSILERFSITALNQMQKTAMDAIKTNNEVLILSPTGSGKTLAFLLPLLSILSKNIKGVQVLIVVPSRELALQIEQVFKQMDSGYKVISCYGGHPVKTEKNNLIEAPEVIIATPGRLAYHIRKENFDTQNIKTLVLDEFDKSLEFGFLDDMAFITQSLRALNKKVLTSATIMDEFPKFLSINQLKTIDFLNKKDVKPDIDIKIVQTEGADKLSKLFQLLCFTNNQNTLVFCNHREAVERISDLLHQMNLAHGIFHGGMDQKEREKSLVKFRNGSYAILVCTDLASRGLDIPETAYVIHYQLPHTLDAYTHRNGRTARMKANGTAFLLLAEGDTVPKFIDMKLETEDIPVNVVVPKPTHFTTIYIAAGKKDKINKIDIVGLFLQKGKLQKEDIGLIEVSDHVSYVAVNRAKCAQVLSKLSSEKLKGKKIKMGEDF